MDIKQHLLQVMQQCAEDMENLQQSSKPISPDNAIGRLTRMEAINSKSVADENIRKLQQRIVKLKAAIKRVEDDEYGICLKCEDEISANRLKSVPEATLCIKCAENSR